MIQMPGLMLIDDTVAELEEIRTALNHAAIPCLPILFDKEVANGGLDKFELKNFEARIIISDLNLKDSTSSRAEDFYPTIARMLQDIGPEKPYVIYFWSKHDALIDDVMERVLKSLKTRNILLPLGYGTLKKSEFSGAANAAALQQKVKSLLTETPYFNALYDWENRIASAAQETSSTLVNLANCQVDDTLEGLEHMIKQRENLDYIISAIANESLGPKNALNAKNEAVDLGLIPVLKDHLHKVSNSGGKWSSAIKHIGEKLTLPTDTVASLNSFYHVSNLSEGTSKGDKGVVVKLSSDLLDGAHAQHKLESKLGISIKELIHEEFISKNKLGKSRAEADTFQQEARDNIILGFIELSADCDQAQRKVKLHRYILCALIPERFKELATSHGTSENPRHTAHDGIYKVPDIYFEGNKYILKLSFKYQIGTKPSTNVNGLEYDNNWLGEPILRLREQILTDISFKCANYSTRPGIISFR